MILVDFSTGKVSIVRNKPKGAAMKLKPRTTYLDGNGNRVCIAGLAAREVEGMPCYWSIAGDHYTEDGHFVFSVQISREPLTLQTRLVPGSLKNIAQEDKSQAARDWWIGVNT